MTESLMGIPVIFSPLCLRSPTLAEEARQIVRHGLADVLTWLGEDVGPAPGERVPTTYLISDPAFASATSLFAHPSLRDKIGRSPVGALSPNPQGVNQ